MKKVIAFITCLVILLGVIVIPEPIEVHAEESNKSYSYYLRGLLCTNIDKQYGSFYRYVDIEFTTDIKICGYFNTNGYTSYLYMYFLDSNNEVLYGPNTALGIMKSNFVSRCSYSKDYYIDGKASYSGDYNYSFSSKSYEGVSGTTLDIYSKGSSFDENGFLQTNIPYFADKASAEAYMNGTLDVTNALNYETDLCDIKYDLEVPQNMQLSLKENLFTLPIYTMTWEQTDSNYKNWTTEVYIYVSVDAWEGALGIHLWGDTYTYEDLFFMAESISTYKLKYVIDTDSDKYEKADEKIMDYVFNDNHKLSGMATDYYKVYMRNAYYDGEYRHYSNWLLVEFDYEFESGQGQTSIIEMGGNVKDNPGSSNPSDDFIGGVVDDSQYDGSVDANLSESSSDILGWIKTGFGIGGDNGVIAMLSDAFDFIPSEIWSVMIAGISLMVAVAVFKFIRG